MDEPLKIVVYWRSGGEQVKALQQRLPQVRFVFVNSEAETAAEIGTAQVLITSGIEWTPSLVDVLHTHAKQLQWIQATSAGIDRFLDYGMPAVHYFSRGGGLWDKPVAEHAMAMILTLARQILTIHHLQTAREWAKWPVDTAIHSLEGKVLGILGYGGIGKELARKGRAFDMQTWGLRRKAGPTQDPWLDRALSLEELPDLLHNADFLAICLPLTAATHNLIGRDALYSMKSDAVVINIARGGILDELALVEVMKEGQLAGAGLDVFEEEPLPADHPLWGMQNVIVSPHVAGATKLRVDKVLHLLEENIARFLEHRPPHYLVDRQAGY